jgi:hypothetical protein
MTAALDAVNDALLVRDGDHVIVASNHRLAVDVKIARPSFRVIAGGGPDGADRALLAELDDVEWVTQRFDRVVIGSGDGVFVPIVHTLRSAGIPVGIVSRAAALSRPLRLAASFVRLLQAADNRVAA